MEKLEPERILAALSAGGAVASRLPHYEPRAAQLELMEMIARAFNEGGTAAAEAGTGVGKSFAYLLPAMEFAALNKERVVISTATITLQQQLFEKDIPLVAAALNSSVKAVLMKGRGNYVCRRRLSDALAEQQLPLAEEQDALAQIARWVEGGGSGSRSELPAPPPDSVWQRVCSDADLCMNKRCPEQERCFVQLKRKEAAAAQIVVANHHLLFADLAARREGGGYDSALVLPPYQRVIIDEAHTIEAAATSFFSKEFGRAGLFQLLGRLYRKRRAAVQGLLARFCSLLPAANDAGADALDALAAAVEGIRAAAEELDAPALELAGTDGAFRFSPERDNSGAESALFPCFASLRKKILAFAAMLRRHLEQIPEQERQSAPAESILWETQSVARRLEAVAGICADFRDYRQRRGEVFWVEKRGQSGGAPWAAFTQSPIELADALGESLFSPNKTVVCVSATLAVNGDFGYWSQRSGAAIVNTIDNSDAPGERRQLLCGCFPSPFPYASAVLLAAPADAPLPDESGYQDFVNLAVGKLAAVSGGSALLLFTSYQSLKSAWAAAQPLLEGMGIRCLRQGDGDRSRLLQAFLADESSVLFATDSFWEGVDAPGDTLRLVVICRLPFRTPNDPVFEARREAVEKAGGNPFMELSLPEAVMKFKQGFGRLMRRSSDRGVVAVLDGRLIKKRYGEYFLRSLPETRTSFLNLEGILRDAERFLF